MKTPDLQTQFASCPSCGSPVRVHTSDEGTSFYEPVCAEDGGDIVREIRDERADRLMKAEERSVNEVEEDAGRDVDYQADLRRKAEEERNAARAALREIAEFDIGVRLAPVAACKEIAAKALREER